MDPTPEESLWYEILKMDPYLRQLAPEGVRHELRKEGFPDIVIERYVLARSFAQQ